MSEGDSFGVVLVILFVAGFGFPIVAHFLDRWFGGDDE
jgi:hypothetical protein